MRTLRTLLVLFTASSLPSAALADALPAARIVVADAAPDVRAQAKRHYEAGETAFRLGDFDRAISEWRQSFELSRVPLLLYNIAQAYRQKGDANKALFFYQQFLATDPTGEPREIAEKRVDELKAVVAAQQKAQSAPPHGPERPPNNITTTAPATESVHEEQPRRRSWTKDPVVWSLLGVGVVAAAVGGGLLGAAANQGDLAARAMTSADFDSHHANDLNLQKGGWPLLAIGATSIAIGGIVIIIDHSRKGR